MARPRLDFSLVGIASAVAVAVLVNVLAARHYTRADWTTGKLYTLTRPTLETLHALDEPVDLWILLGGGDPLEQSLKHLVASYTAETSELHVHYIDPDKDALALADVRKRFHVETAPSPDGRMVTDAIAIVARGDRHWFLTPHDMVEVAQGDDVRAKPREEQAITGAIRRVIAGDKTKLCFMTGHGERSLDDGSEDGLGALRDVLDKDNYDLRSVDTTPENAYEPFKGCDVLLVAAPRPQAARGLGALTAAEENRVRTYLLSGGNLLLALGAEARDAAPGWGKILEPFGVGLDDLLVIEADPTRAFPNAHGDTFVAIPKANPITTGLVPTDEMRDVPKVVLDVARPLRRVPSPATVSDLLSTSDHAFAVNEERASEIARSASLDIPEKRGSDRAGPFVLAMSSERPKVSKDAPHGPRAVVFGSSYAFATSAFRAPLPWHGTAFLMGNAIAWLSSKPEVLDVPDKASVGAGLRMTTATEGEVRRYVLAYMPFTGVLLGVLVAFRRRSTEGRVARKKEMSWRRHGVSLALAALAVALGVWLWVDRGSVTDTERAARPNDVFPAFRRDELSRIEIDKGREKLVLSRALDRDADAGWELESPTRGPADPNAVDQLVGTLEFATWVRKVAPGAVPTFDAPRASGSIQMGKLVFRFALGGPAPTPEGSSYFKVDGSGVFVVSKELSTALLKGADAYESRTIVPYLSLDLASIGVRSSAGDVKLVRTGDLTFAVEPTHLRGSRSALDKLWSALAAMRADRFIQADVKDPAVTVTMTPKDGRPRGVLLVGGACPDHPDDLVVVRTEPTRLAACAPRGVLEGLTQTAAALTDTRLFFAHVDEVEELSLTNADGSGKIELARKGSGWHARAPFDRDLTGDEVDAANAVASGVVRAQGTDAKPIAPGEPFTLRARVRVHGGEMKDDELLDVGEGTHGWVVHRLADHAALDVTPEVARRLRPSKSALKGRDVVQPPLDPKDVTGLALRCGTPQDLARDPQSLKWSLTSPRGYVADQAGVLDLTDQLAHLRADAWVADTDDGSFGFATSACNAKLTARDGRTVTFTLGRDGETGLYAIVADSKGGESPVFLEPRVFRDAVSRILVDRSGLGVDAAAASSVVLSRSGARIELRRVGGVLVGPDAGLPASVESIVSALSTLRADDVVRLGPPAPDEGFDAPSLDVRTVLDEDGGTRAVHVRFGRDTLRKNQAMVFARVDGVDATFAVARERVDPIRNAL